MLTVYASIGNSDDKLTQREWAAFLTSFRRSINVYAMQTYGEWHSLPDSPYQNACVAFLMEPNDTEALQRELLDLRQRFRQDSVAWAVVDKTEFV